MGNVVEIDYPETRRFCAWFRRQLKKDRAFAVPISTRHGSGVFRIKDVRLIEEGLRTKRDLVFLAKDEQMFEEFNLIERCRTRSRELEKRISGASNIGI